MKKNSVFLAALILLQLTYFSGWSQRQGTQLHQVNRAVINDPFWNPKMELWANATATDVLDKFEGKHLKTAAEQKENNVFENFDKVAAGQKSKGGHAGLPWFDGLIYESIRGIGDLVAQYPNPAIQARLDNIVDRIYAAQQADPDGYLNTYTDLKEPDHRWGDHGGFLRWQHDVYNAGMLVEAGVHYYQATGKTKLLEVATRYANYMAGFMGNPPKRNIVPAHSGPEEALIKLYRLYKEQPGLKKKMGVPVNEQAYYDLAKFWIESRGRNSGYPLWLSWGNDKSEAWIREQKYKAGFPAARARPTWGDYAQDSISVFDQKTIEGHAVRATLLATGVATAALENHRPEYMQAVDRMWDNMVGKRMFVTGGVGAIHNDEKFGPDYFLPTDAYLETCAAVGAGFFSQRMNELTGNGKYMDEFERVLYNNVLTGVSLSGRQYTYQNPLNAHKHARWEWHSCPCCPPMFLKMVSSLPDFIYSSAADRVYVNLFIGSNASIQLGDNKKVSITQKTEYPWKGNIVMGINPDSESDFTVLLRIPGWARGKENPYGLYQSNLAGHYTIRVNGKPVQANIENGYAVIKRKWKKSDQITLDLPLEPRIITANAQVKDLKNQIALASGPLIYCLEAVDNASLDLLEVGSSALKLDYRKDLLNGVNVVSGNGTERGGKRVAFLAVPYFASGNREGEGYKVWLPAQKAKITVDASKVENKLFKLIYGSNIEDVNHEIYGGFYDQKIFGESFEEPATGVDYSIWQKYSGYWEGRNGVVFIEPGYQTSSDVFMRGSHVIGVEADNSAKLIYEKEELTDGAVQADMRFTAKGESGGLLVRVARAGVGNDVFDGYEISLARNGKSVSLGKHVHNFELLKKVEASFDSTAWNTVKVTFKGTKLVVVLNGREVISYQDQKSPLLKGKIGLRTWKAGIEFRNISIEKNGKVTLPRIFTETSEQVSYNWDMLRLAGVKASFAIDSTAGYNGKNAQVITFESGSGKAGIANRGLNRWGIAVRKGQVFQGRLYLKAEQLSGPVTVALQSADGGKTYASKTLTNISADWQKYPFEFTANDTDSKAKLTITLSAKGKLWVDQVVLMGTGKDQFAGLPIRADIGNMLVAQGLTFLRYAGTMVNSPEYRFKKMIGDPDKRPPYRGHWNHYSTNGFGIEEFLKYCEAAKITPCFTINIYETPEDMADMVEYFNGDASTKWGAIRAKNGHPKPYGVKYIEIGNEEVLFNGDSREGYEEYVARFKLLHQAMKQKDNALILIHSAWWRPASPNMEFVFRELNGKADYWDLHVGGDNPDEGLETDKKLAEMIGMFRKWDPATKMQIAVFEENGSKHGIQRALGHATNLNAIRRHNEYVLTSSPANALEPYLQNDNDWNQGQIFFTPTQVWGMPPFYSQKMQSENHLPLRVHSESEGGLDVTATRSEDGKTLALHVVNTSAENKRADIQITGFEGGMDEVYVVQLYGELTDRNSPEKPHAHQATEAKTTLAGAAPSFDFGPHSYTILRLSR